MYNLLSLLSLPQAGFSRSHPATQHLLKLIFCLFDKAKGVYAAGVPGAGLFSDLVSPVLLRLGPSCGNPNRADTSGK